METKTKDKMQETIILAPEESFKAERDADHKKRALALPQGEQTVFQQMLAASKDIDIEKLKQLQAMHERAQDREAERLFSEDFTRMQPQLPKVIRLKKNTQTNSNYAALEDINMKIGPILYEHGFGTSMQVLEQNDNGVKVRVFLRHRAGHKEHTDVFMPIDNKGMAGTVNKTMPHAHSSSIMYCRRVGECLLLNISTGDDTDGNLPGDTLPDEVVSTIKEKIKQFEPEYTVKFLKYMKAEAVENILAKDLKRAFNALEQKRKDFEANQAKQKGATDAK